MKVRLLILAMISALLAGSVAIPAFAQNKSAPVKMLKSPPAIQNNSNIDLVTKYYDKLAASMQE